MAVLQANRSALQILDVLCVEHAREFRQVLTRLLENARPGSLPARLREVVRP